MFNYFELNNSTDFQYLLNSAGEDILINGSPARALITNTNLTESRDNKKITTLTNIERGFLIDYDNKKWLIVSEVSGKRYNKYKGIMQRCNNTMTLNVAGILYDVPCIVTDRASLNTDTTQYITTLDTEIYIMVANDATNSNIKVNDIYKIGNLNYQVKNIDDISKSGLLVMKMEFTATEQVLPSYSISITNTEPLSTDTATPVQLTVEQKDGATVLTNPLLMIFSSSDNAIASVDNLGLVTPIAVGNVIITVSLESDASVNDSISITVEEAPVGHNYSITINGVSSIKVGQTSSFTATFYDNGVEVTDQSGTWTVLDTDGTSTTYASITAQTGNSASVKAGSTANVYVNLWCTLDSDNSITASKNIKMASLF